MGQRHSDNIQNLLLPIPSTLYNFLKYTKIAISVIAGMLFIFIISLS